MEPSQLTKQSFEELTGKPLNNDEVAEMVSNLTMFVQVLADIDQLLKLHSKHKDKVKE